VACLQLQQFLLDAVPDEDQEMEMAAVLAAVPRQLWELGSSRPVVSHVLLLLLYQAARLALPGSIIQQQVLQHQAQLAPLLATLLPSPGTAAGAKSGRKHQNHQQQHQQNKQQQQLQQVLVGPLAALPQSCQHIFCDIVTYQPELQVHLLKAVALSCRVTSYSDETAQRLLEGVLAAAAGAAGGRLQPELYISFIVTLLSPVAAAETAKGGSSSSSTIGQYVDQATGSNITAGFARHQLLVNTVCRWLHQYGPLPDVLLLLLPALLEQWLQQQHGQVMGSSSSSSSPDALRRISYSCLAAAAVAANAACTACHGSSGGSTAAAAAIPAELLAELPEIAAAYCCSSISASLHDAATPGSAAGSTCSALPAATAAAEESLAAVLPLLEVLPQQLLLPYLQSIASVYVKAGQPAATPGAASTDSTAVATAAGGAADDHSVDCHVGLAVAVHILQLLLSQQCLQPAFLEGETAVLQVLQVLERQGQQLKQQRGDLEPLQGVLGLQAAVAVLCGH
jgi:hypothetical protein